MTAIIAKLQIKAGKTDEAIALFQTLIAKVRQETGTLYYTVNRDRKDPNLLVVMERYKDDAAFAAHSKSPYLADFFAKSREFLDGTPELIMLDEIASI